MLDTAAKVTRGVSKPFQAARDVVEELVLGIGPTVGELGLGEVPHAFFGIDLGRVGREALELESGVGAAQSPDQVAAVHAAVVPQDDDGAVQMAQQMTQEVADLGLLNVLGVQAIVEPEALTCRTDGEPGDGGDFLSPSLAVTNDRGLPAWCPGLSDRGDQEEPGFIDEDEVGTQPLGVFFTLGHSSRFQRSISSSLRSVARRVGFWWLHFKLCINRPTWSR